MISSENTDNVVNHVVKNSDNANLCRHLVSAAQNSPEALAVAVQKHKHGTLHYDEIDFVHLHQKSDAIAHALNAHGITRGMKCVLMVSPSIDFFALTFALFKAGIVPILVDPGMGIKNLKQCFIESTPDVFIGIPKAHIARKIFGWAKASVKFLLTVSDVSFINKTITAAVGGLNIEQLLHRYPNHTCHQGYEMALLSDDDIAAILFTSGSTGTPKGVVYSHKMFEAQISALKNDYHITSGERDLATFPLFSLFGPALGMASIIPDMDASKPIKANPDFIFAAIEKYQCTNLFANPALIEVLGHAGEPTANKVQHKLPSLKRVISAGAPATLPAIERFTQLLNEGIPVLTSYGATESLPITKIASDALLKTCDVTDNGGGICVGFPVADVEVKIIAISEDPIEHWHADLALPLNTIGEIVVSGPMVSQGYYQRDSATKLAKISDGSANVRHRMGDLGYLDEHGALWMCGRKAHRVVTTKQDFFSIPCERIFNRHAQVKRSALVSVVFEKVTVPLVCIELEKGVVKLSAEAEQTLFKELKLIALQHKQTRAIGHFLIHQDFPVDIRHNAKIFREKLAIWAQKQLP
jgi:acyl-coenzyme A synthetase/AMP-(fatty) acid ligase